MVFIFLSKGGSYWISRFKENSLKNKSSEEYKIANQIKIWYECLQDKFKKNMNKFISYKYFTLKKYSVASVCNKKKKNQNFSLILSLIFFCNFLIDLIMGHFKKSLFILPKCNTIKLKKTYTLINIQWFWEIVSETILNFF